METAHRANGVRSVLFGGYGVAVLAVAVAIAFRLGLNPILGDKGHLIILILPVLIASLRGGAGPGLFTLVFGTSMSFLLYPSSIASRFDEVWEWVTFGLFLVTCGGVIALARRERLEQAARLRSEAELARLNLDLERLVEERTAELRAANEELEGFCHSMAHDMRTPTRAIAGNARILLEDYADQLPEDLADHLARINRAALKQGALVDALLTYARMAKQEVHREPVDVAALVHELVADVARREDAEVVVHVSSGLQVDADPRQLRIALRALLENSVRYRVPNSVAHIEVEGDPEGRLVVADRGIGFDMAFAHKVVMPFERLHRDETYPGVGMGLALVSRIAQRHRGTLKTESQLDRGTTVWLDLGCVARQSVVAAVPEPGKHTPAA
jgi:signal transduction histidine kinase